MTPCRCFFCQLAGSCKDIDISKSPEAFLDYSQKVLKIGNLLPLCLGTVIALINSSHNPHMDNLPYGLTQYVSCLLSEFWIRAHGLTKLNYIGLMDSLLFQKHAFSEAIFRLSMNSPPYKAWDSGDVQTSIFGTDGAFQNFMLNNWEHASIRLKRADRPCGIDHVFSSLVNYFTSSSMDGILYSLLHGLVSCPPIASDELDINCFLEESSHCLGSSVVYGQDIKVVRTNSVSSSRGDGGEEHLHTINFGNSATDYSFLHKCCEAFYSGYSFALRGMEFRSSEFAALTAGLSNLFGLPSVGANVYFSPPQSQGLSVHYDDHCVFVWQIFGRKCWRISCNAYCILPRLYDKHDCEYDSETKQCSSVQIVVEEGDILYVPRGFLHEAKTHTDEMGFGDSLQTGFSLHLTLAVEVELPFEWEGFVHIALHSWTQKVVLSAEAVNSKLAMRNIMLSLVLHVGIHQLSVHGPVLRKACLVAAKPSSANNGNFHNLFESQKATFAAIINKINEESIFAETFGYIGLRVRERDDGAFQWMSWLRHLQQSQSHDDQVDFCDPLEHMGKLVALFNESVSSAEVDFTALKTKFCRSVVYEYEEARRCFMTLLETYRKTRSQYMNGMLALHRKC